MVGAGSVCVGEARGRVCVVQRATHHDGTGQSVVVVPWGVSVTMQECVNTKFIKARPEEMCFSLSWDLFGLRGRPSLDTLRGIAAGLLKSGGGALIRVPLVPAGRV